MWTSEDISELLGISAPTVRKHLNQLEKEGRVEAIRPASPNKFTQWRLASA